MRGRNSEAGCEMTEIDPTIITKVQQYLSQNPNAPRRTITKATGVSDYMLGKMKDAGHIKLVKWKPCGLQHNWMKSAPLGKLKQ